MKKIILLGAMFGFFGCNELKGVIDVQKNFILKTSKGDTTVNPGSYKSSLNLKKNKAIVSVNGQGGDIKFEIKFNSKPNIPANGEFLISRAESNQLFDIKGVNQTTVKRSATKTTTEPCSIPYNDVVCTPQGCFPTTGTRWGQKRTDYYDQTTTRVIQFSLVDDADAQGFAHFNGQQSDTQRVVIREGTCF
ncbi:MAG: hypothetical protein ACK4VO_05925 [Pseudobdellovibrio sp.]